MDAALQLLEHLLEYAKTQKFEGGFMLGALFGSLVAFLMAKFIAFKGHEEIVKQWKTMNGELRKEIRSLKKENIDKDQRLETCHSDLGKLKKIVAQKESAE